jgi:transcriptional regulator with XRE-family HTH domain
MTIASKEFGRRLKRERERRGILLETIAETTKIKASLLADLERGDVARWPRGIFRRAFVREYALAIGLSPDDVAAEFFELFPEEGTPEAKRPAGAAGLRLTLADSRGDERQAVLQQGVVALLEAGALVGVGAGAAWIGGFDLSAACAVVGLAYYPLSSALLGRSPALHLLRERRETARPRLLLARETAGDIIRRFVSQPETPRPDSEAPAMPGTTSSENLQVASR